MEAMYRNNHMECIADRFLCSLTISSAKYNTFRLGVNPTIHFALGASLGTRTLRPKKRILEGWVEPWIVGLLYDLLLVSDRF